MVLINTAKKVGMGLKELGKSHEFIGQGLAQIPKFGISLVSTELGNKVWNSLIGLFGNIINEAYGTEKWKKRFFRSFFTNLMFTFSDPTANQMREVKRNVSDLVSGLKMKNFSTAFGGLIEDPQEVIGAIRGLIPQFKGFKGFKMPSLKKFKNISISRDKTIQEITPDLVTKFSEGAGAGVFSDALSELDLVEY